MTSVLVTGASGFVGAALCRHLANVPSIEVHAATRQAMASQPGLIVYRVADVQADTQWGEALRGVNVVVHCAARVHVMDDKAGDPLAEFRKVNVQGTLNLAKQAIASGVRRFVFISSIKVNGEQTDNRPPFTADEPVAPSDPYGMSKHEAEQALLALARQSGLEVVIIRPVLVYGPGVKANFQAMMRWLSRGVPLPLGAIHNQRSLVALDNLVSLIATCIEHPAAVNQVFLAADGNDLSTTSLLKRLGLALGRPARLLPVPVPLLRLAARLARREAVCQRLCGSLQVDVGKAQDLLGWRPVISVDQALEKTARHFLDSTR